MQVTITRGYVLVPSRCVYLYIQVPVCIWHIQVVVCLQHLQVIVSKTEANINTWVQVIYTCDYVQVAYICRRVQATYTGASSKCYIYNKIRQMIYMTGKDKCHFRWLRQLSFALASCLCNCHMSASSYRYWQSAGDMSHRYD